MGRVFGGRLHGKGEIEWCGGLEVEFSPHNQEFNPR